MIRLQRRHRVLLGALVLAATIWLLDRLSGGGGPQPAQARSTAAAPAPAAPPAWDEVDALVGRIAALRRMSDEPGLSAAARDVFQPSTLLAELLAAAETPPAADTPLPGEDTAGDFAARHRLLGVVIAAEPLAVVDDVVLRLGAVLDGHRLVAVERNAVVFEELATGARVRLTMPVPAAP